MKIFPFKGSHPKAELITSPKSFFSTIKMQYREYRENNIYNDLEEEGFYVYQIQSEIHAHTGLLTLTDIKEMKHGRVLKHEKTLAAKEQQMMHLLLQRKALVKPVLLGFHSNKTIDGILKKIVKKKALLKFSFNSDNEEHLIWQIKDQSTIDKLKEGFSKVKKAYIGDGHHRSTTIKLLSESKQFGAESKKFRQFYTAYFPFDQLQICDYNRVVDISEIISLPEFIIGLSKYFDFQKLELAAKPKKKHQITFYIDGIWYLAKWKEKFITKKKSQVLLDSALVNKYIFGDLLEIADVRVDTRISYFGGTQPLVKIENAADKKINGIGICIFPVSIKELTALADKKQTLPPKSTWFLPRLKSGILTRDLH